MNGRSLTRTNGTAPVVFGGLLLAVVLGLAIACGGGSGGGDQGPGLGGAVKDAAGQPVVGAKVYLVPTSGIDMTKITQADVVNTTKRPAEAYDEPLEDAVRLKGGTFLSAETDGQGSYRIGGTIPAGKYFAYVVPASSDAARLPGGDACRVARDASSLNGQSLEIKLSGKPAASASYIGSTACVACHASYAGSKYTAHALTIAKPGTVAGLQNQANFPNHDEGTRVFKNATAGTNLINGLRLTAGDYDSSRGFDKFKVYEDATKVTTASMNIFLWKDQTSGAYKMTLVNVANSGDPNSPLTLNVKMAQGGMLYKMRYLVEVPAALTGGVARKGSYPVLQFQGFPGISYGVESSYDREKSKWRDYNLADWWNNTTKTFVAPATTKTFEAKCAPCHFTGYQNLRKDALTGEWLANAVEDDGGAYDLDGNGKKEEVAIGCESCHGPGSEHKAANNATGIVSPAKLTPAAENMVCGMCHDRASGKGSTAASDLQGGDMLFDSELKLPRPGMSRAEVITNHTARPSAATSALWSDGVHSKSHHQQYSDFVRSKHYRNDRQLVVCSDCHDMHAKRTLQGKTEHPHNLRADPRDPTGALCMKCHDLEYTEHMNAKTGAQHMGLNTACSDCHMPRTAFSGPGQYGQKLASAGSAASTAVNTYLMGDITSHVLDVPDKLASGVVGTTPGSAMPAPYTNKCGACHLVDGLSTSAAIK